MKNFLNKNINESKDINNKIINNPNEILKMQAKFYSDSFSTKNINIEQHTRYTHFLSNIPKINKSTRERSKPIDIKELEEAIRSSKNNKAPGPDGFSKNSLNFLTMN